MKEKNSITGCYAESGDTCTYTLWRKAEGTQETRFMHTDQRPDWLDAVVNAARVGGHMKEVRTPPPSYLVWFHLNKDGGLLDFIEHGQRHVSDADYTDLSFNFSGVFK